MKKLFKILLFFGTIFSISAWEPRSITIKNVGDRDRDWEVLIINTRKDGWLIENYDGYLSFAYYVVDESTFDEIIDLINLNKELFIENLSWRGFGSFELYIELEGESYYRYFNERKSSLLFFEKLLKLIKEKGNYERFVRTLEMWIWAM